MRDIAGWIVDAARQAFGAVDVLVNAAGIIASGTVETTSDEAWDEMLDINLRVQEKERIVICGPSGSGKSTLIRCVNRLEEYQKGHILIEGRDLHGDDIDVNLLRAEIGIVFQQFNLYPHLSVLKNITLAPIKVKKAPPFLMQVEGAVQTYVF